MSRSINNAKWKLLTHSMSKDGSHKMLAGYKSLSRGGLNKIFFLAPLYNMNDANLDGRVSGLEWLFGKNLYDPYSVFELFSDANKACCTIDAAVQLRDYDLRSKALMGMLRASHKAASKALVTITVEKILSPGFEKVLAISKLADMGRFSDSLLFLVQTGLESAVEAVINKSRGVK